jgi:cytochrome P450
MVSAGLDTVPGNLTMGVGFLSTKQGQAVQSKALCAIEEAYPNGDAWEKCLAEEKVPYITALVKETLRFWTVIPMCLPRTSIKDIPWNDAVVPAGTTFFMVSLTIAFVSISRLCSNISSCRTPTLQITTNHGLSNPSSSSLSVS